MLNARPPRSCAPAQRQGTRDLLRWTLFELFLAHRELAQLKAQGNTK